MGPFLFTSFTLHPHARYRENAEAHTKYIRQSFGLRHQLSLDI